MRQEYGAKGAGKTSPVFSGTATAFRLFSLLILAGFACLPAAAAPPAAETHLAPGARAPHEKQAEHVIHVSIDGLRPDVIPLLGAVELPNFYRFRREGAWTDNARTDYDYSNTLPNHTSQLLGRPVLGPEGHNWTVNKTPTRGTTLHANKGAYMASVFDVVHDHGYNTGAFVSKDKFVVYDWSYGAGSGAPDTVGADDGRDKIDVFVYDKNTAGLVSKLVRTMRETPLDYVFLHLRDLDSHGHDEGWDLETGSDYTRAVKKIDDLLGQLFDLVETTPALAGRTAILLTADHGGDGTGHGDAGLPENYTIPFYVWGAGAGQAQDLYGLNAGVRQDPGAERPSYEAPLQPIRNGDAANLALSLMGLGSVPGSTINTAAALKVLGSEAEDRARALPVEDAIGDEVEAWLSPAFPNPFGSRTRFSLLLEDRQHVRMAIYDAMGRRRALLFDGTLSADTRHPFSLEAGTLPSGMYVINATGESFSASRSIFLIK